MQKNINTDPVNLQEACMVENVISKLKNGIELYHMGMWSAEIFAYKVEEYSNKLKKEVLNG